MGAGTAGVWEQVKPKEEKKKQDDEEDDGEPKTDEELKAWTASLRDALVIVRDLRCWVTNEFGKARPNSPGAGSSSCGLGLTSLAEDSVALICSYIPASSAVNAVLSTCRAFASKRADFTCRARSRWQCCRGTEWLQQELR